MKRRNAGNGSGAAEQSVGEAALTVGTRVRTYPSADSAVEGPFGEAGVVVDDFGEILTPHEHYGRDWGLTKRWAIALDNGALVFRDDNEVERES